MQMLNQTQNNNSQKNRFQVDTGGDGDNVMGDMEKINKLAEFFATNGDYHSAIEQYVKMVSIDSENGPAWTALGHCCLLVEDLQNSFNAYQRALYCLDDIKDPQLWYGIGILYEKFESYDHAISALVAVLKMSPNFYQKCEVLFKLGMIFAKTNQISQAISYFKNSLLSEPFSTKRKTDIYIKIGILYEEQNQHQ
jgi:tetratricopeptide (TPR) repeat protein